MGNNRCHAPNCKKKIGLISFECKCGKVFCGKHRTPETHNCSYDHKTDSKNLLREKMIKVEAEKLPAI